MHNRDGIYGEIFKQRVKNLGIEEVVKALGRRGRIRMSSG